MRTKRVVLSLAMSALIAMASPVFAHMGEDDHMGGAHDGGYHTGGHHTSQCHLQAAGSEEIVQHMLHPSIPQECAAGHYSDGVAHPARINHYNSQGMIDHYYQITYSSGHPTRVVHRNVSGASMGHTVCQYNSTGRLTRTLNYNASGTLTGHTNYAYNAAGKLTAAHTYQQGVRTHSVMCSYNAKGQLVRTNHLDAAGNLQCYRKCVYNTAGKLVRATHCNPDGTVVEYKQYAYNSTGKPARVVECNPNGTVIGECRYMRDGSGRLTQTQCRDAFGNPLGHSACPV